jgi:hypothetical protein
MRWLKRFGLHLAAAVGATGVFVAAAAVGANQTRQQSPPPIAAVVRAERTPLIPRPSITPRPRGGPRPERSLAGTIHDVQPDAIEVLGVGGRLWQVAPVPGALIRLNGKPAPLDALQVGDEVVVLGQAEPGPGLHFMAHAITARR